MSLSDFKIGRLTPALQKQFFLFIVLLNILPSIRSLIFYGLFGFPIYVQNFRVSDPFFLKVLMVATALGILAIIGCLIRHKNRHIIGLLPVFFPFAFALAGNWGMPDIDEQGNLSPLVYAFYACTQISFLYFISKGKLRSVSFLSILLLLFIWSGLLETLLFLLYALLFRFLYYATKQNIEIFKNTGFVDMLKILGKTFLYWCPLLLLIIPGHILTNKVYKSAMDAVYRHSFIVSTDSEKKYEIPQFEKDLSNSMDDQTQATYHRINEQEKAMILEAKKTGTVPKDIVKRFGNDIPDDLKKISKGFRQEDCGFLGIKCEVKNWTKRELNKTYKSVRKKSLNNLEVQATEKGAEGADQAIAAIQATANRACEELEGLNQKTQKSISFIFWSILLLSITMDILLGLVILKSFMYVFARVAFSNDTDNYVTFMESDAKPSQGNIHKTGNQYTIPAEQTNNYYVSRIYEPSGRAPKIALPQITKAILARIFTRNYLMNKIVMDKRDEPVYFRSIGSQEFVEWEIKEGEEIIFHFSNFVGMSETLQLSAIISLRLSSLLMGRIIFTSAKGPGKIILLSQGKPAVTGDPKAEASVATSRILAWDKNARFHVESELNIFDVFLSGIYLKKKPEDFVLIDADAKGKAKSGIAQFIKHFLLPI